ncbi:MAG: NTP transferase domain-containing protein [Polyangiaceae bacterium]
MQIIILAAGLGSRLGKGLPKALVEVAGKTLLEHQMAWTRGFNPERTIVITGFHHADVAALCAEKFPDAIVIENERYQEQNLYSLLAAHDYLDDDTLIMNVDHLYPATFATRACPTLATVRDFAIFADTDRVLTDDDMKLFVGSGGRVEKISKKLTEWTGGYIGMTFIRKDFWRTYREAAAAVAEALKEKAVVEAVIQELVNRGHFPEIVDSNQVEWYEIDTPEELIYAEQKLAAKAAAADDSSLNFALYGRHKKVKTFAGVDADARWTRALEKLDVASKRKLNIARSDVAAEIFANHANKTAWVLADFIVDDVTLEQIAESVYPSVGANEIAFVESKLGLAPVFVVGKNLGQSLAGWQGWQDEDFTVDRLLAHARTLENATVTVKTLENGFWGRLSSEAAASKVEWEYLKFLKFRPGGLVAKYLNRPISILITKPLLKYPAITPNVVTGVDFIIGLVGISLFLLPGYLPAVLGGAVIHFNSIVDGVDGEIARMRHQGSSRGAWLDSICDETLGALLYLAIGYHLYVSGQSYLFFVAGILTAVASYTYALTHWHCKLKHGLGFYFWWECYKPRREVQRSTSVVSYLKKLLWRDSVLLIVFLAAICRVLDAFLLITLTPALINLVLIGIHIFIKRARW